MSPREAMEIIVAIERQCDVNAVRYRGLRVWPLIRLSLWSRLHQPAGEALHDTLPGAVASRLDRATDCVRKARLLFQLVSPLTLWRFLLGRWELRGLQGAVDFVFLSRPEDHADRINGSFVNRHVDPMMDFLKGQWRCVKIEPDSQQGRTTRPRVESTIYIDARYRLLKHRFLSLLAPREPIEGFPALQKVILEVSGGVQLEERHIVLQARRLAAYGEILTAWLARLRPKAAFVVCYYDPISMALVEGCKRLQISTVDIQHGKQGKYHGLYTHWTKIPDDGYELLPDFFWSWGWESKSNIERWYPQGCRHHRPVVGGNRWLAMWRHRDLDEADPSSMAFYESLKGFKKVILVTLQPGQDPLPLFLMDAMGESPDEWLWLIRLHPLSRGLAEWISVTLKERGIANFEIHWATLLPLYALLRRVTHHITCWSSVCYETLPFRVPTTIVDPTGLELYEEYIRRGIFGYAENSAEVLESIGSPMEEERFAEPRPYIETGEEQAKTAIKIILNGAGKAHGHTPSWAQ